MTWARSVVLSFPTCERGNGTTGIKKPGNMRTLLSAELPSWGRALLPPTRTAGQTAPVPVAWPPPLLGSTTCP